MGELLGNHEDSNPKAFWGMVVAGTRQVKSFANCRLNEQHRLRKVLRVLQNAQNLAANVVP